MHAPERVLRSGQLKDACGRGVHQLSSRSDLFECCVEANVMRFMEFLALELESDGAACCVAIPIHSGASKVARECVSGRSCGGRAVHDGCGGCRWWCRRGVRPDGAQMIPPLTCCVRGAGLISRGGGSHAWKSQRLLLGVVLSRWRATQEESYAGGESHRKRAMQEECNSSGGAQQVNFKAESLRVKVMKLDRGLRWHALWKGKKAS